MIDIRDRSLENELVLHLRYVHLAVHIILLLSSLK